jgi:hypothetical protein
VRVLVRQGPAATLRRVLAVDQDAVAGVRHKGVQAREP